MPFEIHWLRRVMETLLYLYCFTLFLIAGVIANPIESDASSLYNANDNVTELYGNTFNDTVFNSPHIWMVEFYSSWCGHCQAFAPIFKAFAKDIAAWNLFLRTAAWQCDEDISIDIDTDEDLMQCKGYPLWIDDYPEAMVFPPFSTSNSEYIRIEDSEVKTLRSSSVKLVDRYLDQVKWSLHGKSKPTFTKISIEEVRSFHKFDKTSFYLALIIGEDPRDIGREVILDLSSCRNITMRRFDNDPDEIRKLEKFSGIPFKEFPTVIVLSQDGIWKEIKVEFKRRHFYSYKLQRLPGVGNPELIPQSSEPYVKRTVSDVDWKKVDRSKVYMADLESSLRYALSVEIASLKTLEGKTLDAVRRFIGILDQVSEQFPMRVSTQNFFSELTGWLVGQSKISRKDWLRRIQTKEEENFLPQLDQKWVGCAPSKPGLRGYPCSLWTLFHSLSVAAHNADVEDALAVPRAMEAYITTFFSCKECRQNFVKELQKYPYQNLVFTSKEAILWLWDVHNEVNRRLHGEISEDPNIPKVQYPPKEMCPKCRNAEGNWNRDRVFHHLVNRYSIRSVSEDFIKGSSESKDVRDYDFDTGGLEDTLLADLMNRRNDGINRNGNPKILVGNRRKHDSFHSMQQMSKRQLSKRLEEQQNGWSRAITTDLSYFDTSLCVILWATSLLVVAVMYLYLKRAGMPMPNDTLYNEIALSSHI